MSNIYYLISILVFLTTLSETNPIIPSSYKQISTEYSIENQREGAQQTTLKPLNLKEEIKRLAEQAPDLDQKTIKLALTAYEKAVDQGAVKKKILTIIDYSLPSNKQRMWIFDLATRSLLYHTYVAHGKNSGFIKANRFSNEHDSKATSLGTFVTGSTYTGSKGYSLNIEGLEEGINDNAYDRRVVVHGAWYMEPEFIKRTGRAGRSWGCPSIAETMAKSIINTIKNGSVIFAYYPDNYYLSHSDFAVA